MFAILTATSTWLIFLPLGAEGILLKEISSLNGISEVIIIAAKTDIDY